MRWYQEDNCALCKEPLNGKVVIDHNHSTGMVRGLLHNKCNMVLGYLEKNPDLVKLAENFIVKFARYTPLSEHVLLPAANPSPKDN